MAHKELYMNFTSNNIEAISNLCVKVSIKIGVVYNKSTLININYDYGMLGITNIATITSTQQMRSIIERHIKYCETLLTTEFKRSIIDLSILEKLLGSNYVLNIDM